MKKNLFFYLFAVLCTVSLFTFTSCSEDNGEEPEVIHPLSGSYKMTVYETEDLKNEDGEVTKANFPVAGPLYAKWTGDVAAENFAGIFRLMGGAMLPQVLNGIELKNDGNIVASYVENPTVQSDKLMGWSMAAFMGTYPVAEEVTALAATGGFVTSPDGLATWAENNGVFTVKLNLTNIITTATGNDATEIVEMIENILNQEPAQVKALLAVILGEKVKNITDETIKQLQGWVLNGIPMTKQEEGGKVYLFLDKKDLDSMMTLRDTGETDPIWGTPIMKNDLMYLWDALSERGMIPEDAKMLGSLIEVMGGMWSVTEDFNLGLSLERVK